MGEGTLKKPINRQLSPATKLAILLYSVFVSSLLPLIYFLAKLMPSLKKQLAERDMWQKELSRFSANRASKQFCVLFLCSSAGEFEQALTTVNQLKKAVDTYVIVVFHSASGWQYAHTRGESIDQCLAPIDTIWNWRKFFDALNPDATVVVRHELWPAFLAAAYEKSYLMLINASAKPDVQKISWPASALLKYFDRIFVVDPKDEKIYHKTVSNGALIVSGDTKYDRAFERLDQQSSTITDIRQKFDEYYGPCHRFIVGSAWRPDAIVSLNAYLKVLTKTQERWQLILAPHDISIDMISWLKEQCSRADLSFQLFTEMRPMQQSKSLRPDQGIPPVVIVNTMGKLAEIYGCANLCLVGGALHHRVHNVLEPAVHGLRITFGPRYHTQGEAVLLKEAGLVETIRTSEELAQWWLYQAKNMKNENQILKKMHDLSGATQIILNDLQKAIH